MGYSPYYLLVCVFMIAITKDFIGQNFTVTGDVEKNAKAIKESLLPSLFSSTIAIFFLSHIISKVTEFAGAMANGVMIQSSNLVASAGAMVQNYATGGAKAASAYVGRHTGAAVGKIGKDAASAAWNNSLQYTTVGQGAKAAHYHASNIADSIANSTAGRYISSLHRAGNRGNTMAEMGKKVDDLHKQAFPN